MATLLTIFKGVFKSKNTSKNLREHIKDIENGVDSLRKEVDDKFKDYTSKNSTSSIKEVKNIFDYQKESLEEIYLKELNELREKFGNSKIGSKEKKLLENAHKKIDKEIKSIDRLLSPKTKHLKNSEPGKNDFGLTTQSTFKVRSSDNFDINTFNRENNTFKTLVKNTSRNNEQAKPKQISI